MSVDTPITAVTERVLTAAPPAVAPADAVRAAAELFGVAATAAVDLGSERDRTFALGDPGGATTAVLKVSNHLENPRVLDMEAAAALLVSTQLDGVEVALPWRPHPDGSPGPARPGDPPETLRAKLRLGDRTHWVRLYDTLPGASRIDASALDDAAVAQWGATAARLAIALRSFHHPNARRRMLWDIQYAADVRELTSAIGDSRHRALAEKALDTFAQRLAPAWPRLRAQTLHGDLSVDNTLSDATGRITGIIDFGDMGHTALLSDLATVLESVTSGREGAELLRTGRLALDGYQRHLPLEAAESDLIGLAWATRAAVTIAISCWRVSRELEDQAYAERYNERSAQMIETLSSAGWRVSGAADGRNLSARRERAFGPSMEALFYDDPVEVASAAGTWITDAGGQRLLDAYNNVPVVGHGHPRVTAAIARQSREINTHMRYLHPTAIELAERLVALSPDGLDTVVLVNSGSEANDVAWRMAAAVTGHTGGLCTACAYHGITEATAALSPEGWLDGAKPDNVETWAVPDTYRGRHGDVAGLDAAIARLADGGHAPAAAILDGLVMSDGVADLDPAYVRECVARVRAAGGLWIADEVQASHGRNGRTFWSYEHFGITPDFVTLGKPMGNGHPVAAVITRREIAAAMGARTVLFSTFGGNPVSAAAALAVLDVVDDERTVARTGHTGQVLGTDLRALRDTEPVIGEVRGTGLAYGVEIVAGDGSTEPDASRASAIRDRMRHHGVLVGSTGPNRNVLKVRPPLSFGERHIPVLIDALGTAISETRTVA